MKFKINYKSVVALGGFNPCILSSDFLAEYCGYKPDEDAKGRTTPIISEIKSSNFHFLMELEKFQIAEHGIADFEDKEILDIMITYLNILKYTPVSKIGINFNYNLSDVAFDKLASKFKDPFKAGKKFKIEPLEIRSNLALGENNALFLHDVMVSSSFKADINRRLSIVFNKEGIIINSNYEVNGLDKTRNRTDILSANYVDVFEDNDSLIKYIGEL